MSGESTATAPDLAAFDPFDAGIQQDPHPWYARMRRDAPVHHAGGVWLVTRHDDIQAALRDPTTFSNAFGGPSTALGVGDDDVRRQLKEVMDAGYPTPPTLLTNDPPSHTRFRRLVGRAFTPKRVESWLPVIEQTCEELIDAVVDRGRCELVEDVAVPLPVRVIADALGVPREHQADFKRWSDDSTVAIGAVITPERRLEAARGIVEYQHYFAARIEERRAEPGDDLVSALVHARTDDDRPLDVPEILAIVQQLLVAGNETTTKLLCEGALLLATHPEWQERVRHDPSIVPNLVEEVLRLAAPTQGMFRVVTRDTMIGGVDIPAGSMAVLLYASANRDDTHFDEPDRFDPLRENARAHLSFGGGIHYCVGASLAKAETQVALRQLCERLPDFRLADDDLAYEPSFILRGLKRLHLAWEVDGA